MHILPRLHTRLLITLGLLGGLSELLALWRARRVRG
jgi:hypothetical protein